MTMNNYYNDSVAQKGRNKYKLILIHILKFHYRGEIRKMEIKLCLATHDVTRAAVIDWLFIYWTSFFCLFFKWAVDKIFSFFMEFYKCLTLYFGSCIVLITFFFFFAFTSSLQVLWCDKYTFKFDKYSMQSQLIRRHESECYRLIIKDLFLNST